jgi:hypothetical protein
MCRNATTNLKKDQSLTVWKSERVMSGVGKSKQVSEIGNKKQNQQQFEWTGIIGYNNTRCKQWWMGTDYFGQVLGSCLIQLCSWLFPFAIGTKNMQIYFQFVEYAGENRCALFSLAFLQTLRW